jgi:RNA polymerase II subunit A small phosphatase-like protein
MDETLINARFKHRLTDDFLTHFEIDYQGSPIYVSKRPYLDEFLMRVSPNYEIVIFTAGT